MNQPRNIDKRELRITSAFTAAILSSSFVLFYFYPLAAGLLLAWQAIIFLTAGFYSLHASPWSYVHRRVFAKRLSDQPQLVEAEPAWAASRLGFIVSVGVLMGLAGESATIALLYLVPLVLGSLVNAVFGYSLIHYFYSLRLQFARAIVGDSL